eukprot:2343827-Rhodomonas_salina.1
MPRYPSSTVLTPAARGHSNLTPSMPPASTSNLTSPSPRCRSFRPWIHSACWTRQDSSRRRPSAARPATWHPSSSRARVSPRLSTSGPLRSAPPSLSPASALPSNLCLRAGSRVRRARSSSLCVAHMMWRGFLAGKLDVWVTESWAWGNRGGNPRGHIGWCW